MTPDQVQQINEMGLAMLALLIALPFCMIGLAAWVNWQDRREEREGE